MNKLILFLVVFFLNCLLQVAYGGAGTFPQGENVRFLKDNLIFKNSDLRIMSGDTDDPSAVAKSAVIGSMYFRSGSAEVYFKTDGGSSTNWEEFITGLVGLTSDVTGVLPVANGGTNSSSALSNSLVMESVGGAVVESTTTSAQLDLLNGRTYIPNAVGANDRVATFDGVNSLDGSANFTNNNGVVTITGQLDTDNIRIDTSTISNTLLNADIDLTPNGTGDLNLTTGHLNVAAQGELRLQDADSSDFMGFRTQAVLTTSTSFTLPDGDGTLNQVLKTDGSGILSWEDDSSSPTPNPNILLNGNMNFESMWTAGSGSLADGSYILDVWEYIKTGTGSVVEINQNTDVPNENSVNSMDINTTTADASVGAADYASVEQPIEGFNIQAIAGKDFTISFYIRSPKTGTHCGSVQNSARDRSYPFEFSVSVINTWEKKTVTITHDVTGTWNYDDSEGMKLILPLIVGSNFQGTAGAWAGADDRGTANCQNLMDNTANILRFSQVKLEVGDTATAYMDTTYNIGLEKNAIERLFQVIAIGSANFIGASRTISSDRVDGLVRYRTKMRAAPSVTLNDRNGGSGSISAWGATDEVIYASAEGALTSGAGSTVSAVIANDEMMSIRITAGTATITADRIGTIQCVAPSSGECLIRLDSRF